MRSTRLGVRDEDQPVGVDVDALLPAARADRGLDEGAEVDTLRPHRLRARVESGDLHQSSTRSRSRFTSSTRSSAGRRASAGICSM